MFGYIRVWPKELKLKEFDIYRSYYCGLCHALKKQYGRTGQILLNYDMTFLAILLSALYESSETLKKRRCALHPARPHEERSSEMTDYAADMTILLSYEKAVDDWQDDRSPKGLWLKERLKKRAEEAAQRWPRQAECLRENVEALRAAEKRGACGIDEVSNLTGNFLAELFVREEDIWQSDLRRMGFFLGKFIYLMDAWTDRDRDRKKGSYNLFVEREKQGVPCSHEEVKQILTDMMAQSASAFERLPILENAAILRNILYAGVWSQYTE